MSGQSSPKKKCRNMDRHSTSMFQQLQRNAMGLWMKVTKAKDIDEVG